MQGQAQTSLSLGARLTIPSRGKAAKAALRCGCFMLSACAHAAQLVAQLRRLAELLRAPATRSAGAPAPQEPAEAGARPPAAQDARSPPTEALGEGTAPGEQDAKRRRSSAGGFGGGFGAGRARRLGAKSELATLTLGVCPDTPCSSGQLYGMRTDPGYVLASCEVYTMGAGHAWAAARRRDRLDCGCAHVCCHCR